MPHEVPLSVLMPCYNAGPYLQPAIQSILGQTFPHFELIVIDDGSTDGSHEVLSGIVDSRLRVIRHATNRGVAASRQQAIKASRGRYIAWADADDISLPDRLRLQVEFLDRRPDVLIVGSACEVIDECGVPSHILPVPTDPLNIRWISLLTTPFLTSSVTLRSAVIHDNRLEFDPEYVPAEDYDFWVTILRFGKGANFACPLVQYRVHSASLSSCHRSAQLRNADRIVLRTIREVLPSFSINLSEASQLRKVIAGGESIPMPWQVARLYLDLYKAFRRTHGGTDSRLLRRNVAAMLAHKVARPWRSPNSVRLLRAAVALDPSLLIKGATRLMRKVGFLLNGL